MSNKEELYRKVALNLINKCISNMHDDCWEYGCSEERQTISTTILSYWMQKIRKSDLKKKLRISGVLKRRTG